MLKALRGQTLATTSIERCFTAHIESFLCIFQGKRSGFLPVSLLLFNLDPLGETMQGWDRDL